MWNKRSHIIEDLDNLELKGQELIKVLDGLSTINHWFGNTRQTLKVIQKQFEKYEIKTIVDLGCGGGDNLISLAEWYESKNKTVKLIGIDGNQNSLNYAESKSDFNIDFIQADILSPDFELPECDLLISSHFIYHFRDEKLIAFLNKANVSVKKGIIFSELERSAFAYFLFLFVGGLFGRMIRSDGLKAIKRSFKKRELTALLKDSEFKNYQIRKKLLFRLLVVIEL